MGVRGSVALLVMGVMVMTILVLAEAKAVNSDARKKKESEFVRSLLLKELKAQNHKDDDTSNDVTKTLDDVSIASEEEDKTDDSNTDDEDNPNTRKRRSTYRYFRHRSDDSDEDDDSGRSSEEYYDEEDEDDVYRGFGRRRIPFRQPHRLVPLEFRRPGRPRFEPYEDPEVQYWNPYGPRQDTDFDPRYIINPDLDGAYPNHSDEDDSHDMDQGYGRGNRYGYGYPGGYGSYGYESTSSYIHPRFRHRFPRPSLFPRILGRRPRPSW